MQAVRCSGTQLPFLDHSFDGTVVSDVMEHMPPEKRREMIAEVLRVTRKIAVFGYPCGPNAFALDKKLFEDYQRLKKTPPTWLEEHMLYPFPTEGLFEDLPLHWKKKIIPNESLEFHYWMMRKEMHRPANYLFGFGLATMPRVLELLLRRADHEPSYRKLFVLTRQDALA